MSEMTGGHAVVKALKAEGVEVVFGLPGVQIMQLYDGFFEHPDVQIISTRHEQAAAFMADGYARSTGKIGVAVVVPGPGLYNACAALATAYAASSPVLLISGQVESTAIGKDRGALHQVHDQLEVVRPVTKWRQRVMRVEEIPEVMHEAMRQLRTGRPRPVEVEIPPDVLAAKADLETMEPGNYPRPAANARDIAAAAEILAAATHPLIWAGGGVNLADAGPELQGLAELLNAPVLTTAEGKGAIPDTHPLVLGLTSGFGAPGAAAQLGPQTDAVLAVGTRFNLIGRAHWVPKEPQKLVHLDIDPGEFGKFYPATVAMAADAKVALKQLTQALRSRQRHSVWDRQTLATLKASGADQAREAMPRYYGVYQEMRQVLGDDGIVISGLTGLAYGSNSSFPVCKPRTWLTSSYMGTLGFEFSAALGAKVGNPHKPVVAMVGDGGFLYSVGELATTVQHGINVVAIVYNNHAFGASNNDQRVRYRGRVIGTELHNPDFVLLAQSFGAQGLRVSTPEDLPAALDDAIKRNKPTVLELQVPTGEMPVNLYGPPQPR